MSRILLAVLASASIALILVGSIGIAQTKLAQSSTPATAPPVAPQPTIALTPTAAPVCTPATACVCNCPDPNPAVLPAPLADYKGRLERTQYSSLPDFDRDTHAEAVVAFVRGCDFLMAQGPWQGVCTRAKSLPQKLSANLAKSFFVDNFDPWTVINADETRDGLVTGYYEPLLNGSRTKTEKFRYPIYSEPSDLITVDLGEAVVDVKHKRLRGRLVANKVVPYLEREEIESDKNPLKGLEMVYVDDPVELFFLQIQGSGQIKLADGTSMRVGYANQNGHPFRSLGGALIRAREIRIENASMQGIKAWAIANPNKIQSFMNRNPSYVFFKELRGDLPGPIGTLGAPLTGERSIAVDPRVVPLGPPVYLATTLPSTKTPLHRLMVAQDTGGAIAGGVRADFYWGFGDGAGQQAGRMKQSTKMWVLLPKGYSPDQITTAK